MLTLVLRSAGKLFNPRFLRGRGLPVPEWLDDTLDQTDAQRLTAVLKDVIVPPEGDKK